MSSVGTILQKKPRGVISVTPSTSVLDALQIMASKNIGSVVVMEDSAYLGILTERDYARKVILQHKSSSETTAGEIMSTNLPRVNPSDSHESCMSLMVEHNVRYLPVFDDGVLVGIISLIDVIQATVEKQKVTIGELQNFISSNFA
ncbi:MAG: CBS domain-containing protein [Saprospiraceae bacterium]|nr:CBS domain-containing protein [Saprospiraceae bacterium]